MKLNNERKVELDKKAFIEFMIESGVLTFGDFTTKSGRKSPYFINTGNYKTGEQIAKLGAFYASAIEANLGLGGKAGSTRTPVADATQHHRIEALFGPAYKGIPLAVTTAIALYQSYGINVNYCFNRKEAKDHGEGGTLVGYKPKDGDKILILEDVITAGTAIRETLPQLMSVAKVEIGGLFISVDRMEIGQGGLAATEEIKRDFGIETFSLVTIMDIFNFLSKGDLSLSGSSASETKDLLARMEAYLSLYCREN